MAAYIYDQPTVSGGAAFANAMRNSGAGRVLLPYRMHRVGLSDSDGMAMVNEVLGTTGNPVVGLSISGEVMTVTFADNTTDTLTLPAGGGSGEDQVARDSAAAAQATADGAVTDAATAQGDADTANAAAGVNATGVSDNADAITALPTPFDWAQEGNSDLIPGTKINQTIRGTKVHVSGNFPLTGEAGDILIRDLTTVSPSIYEWDATHGWQLDYTFQGGRVHVVTSAHDIAIQSPVANGGDILFELVSGTLKLYRRLNASSAPYWQYYGEVTGGGGGGGGGDQIARDAAAAAAVTLLQTSTTAHYADANAHHVPPTGGGGAVSESARLPVGTVVLRLGWAQTKTPAESIFTRADLHPTDGAAVGTVAGLYPPPFPPALNTDPDLYLFIWIASAPSGIADLVLAGGGTLLSSFSNAAAYTLESVDGTLYISEQRLSAGISAYQISAVVGGALIASQPWVTSQLPGLGGPVKLGNWTGNLVLQRQFREGCGVMPAWRRGAWHGSVWPVRYCPAYPQATAATRLARTVPGAAFPAPPGRPAAS